MMGVIAVLLVCGLSFSHTPIFAQEKEPLVTDRPDFVEASATVGKSILQVETSGAFTRTDSTVGDRNETTTPTLFRYGILDDWELRLETDGFIYSDFDGGSENGIADISAGFKWHALDGQAGTWKPSMGWLVHVDLDTGSSEFRGDGARPSLRGVAEWEFLDRFALGVMGGAIYDNNPDDDRFWAGIFGIVVGYNFTDSFRGFTEFAAEQIADDKDGGNILNWNSGVAYLINPDWQIDAAISAGLTDDTPDYSVTVGLSMRFDVGKGLLK